MKRCIWACSSVLAACAGYDPDEVVGAACPAEAPFEEHVSPLLERRCGTLDCHGVPARPLVIYGKLGLRLGDDLAGSAPTTGEEQRRNWLACCGLEPELTDRVVRGEAEPEALLLIKKPLEVVSEEESVSGESHKGGAVIERGAADHRCLESWLRGFTDEDACATASTTVR